MVFIRQYISWILALLMLFGLFGFSSTVLAEKGKWTKKADMPTARATLSISVVNGKIYVIGGSQFWPLPTSTVEEYDPATDTWRKKADMPTARYALAAVTVNEKIYAIGGLRREVRSDVLPARHIMQGGISDVHRSSRSISI